MATTIATVVAYLLVPMRSLGQDSWKIAAALMARHIGGGMLKQPWEPLQCTLKEFHFLLRSLIILNFQII